MSYPNNFRNGPSKSFSSCGAQRTTNQLNMTRTSTLNPYQPRTPMVYSQSPAITRNQLTESEPLSEYSEMQIPMTPMRPTHQLNPPNNPYFHVQEAAMSRQISPYPRMPTASLQNTPRAGMMESGPQSVGSHNIRATPYTRSSFPPHPQPSLLPAQTPPYYVAPQTPKYNPDHSFVMRSTTSSSADSTFLLTPKKTEGGSLIKMSGINAKTATQAAKLTSVNRKRFFIGSIDQIGHWHKMAKEADLHVIYEVIGILDSLSYHPKEKVYKMIIRDDQKASVPPLQAVFFPIDRKIPEVQTGGLTTFVGRMIGARKLQALNMWPTDANSLAGLKRISFLCQRTLQEASFSASEP